MAQKSGDTYQEKPFRRVIEDVFDTLRRNPFDRRLIVASNRGPFRFKEDDGGDLVAGHALETLEVHSEAAITWISGVTSAADRKAAQLLASGDGSFLEPVLPDSWKLRLVSPPRRVHHKFYNFICNPLLWFLLHRSWSPTFTPTIGAQEHDAWDTGYRAVNESYVNEISASVGEDRFVLITSDYQLMLVPGLVRERHPDALIRHSFETPWPWPSDLQILPAEWRLQLLHSLLSADEISFPSVRDIRAFVACASEFLGDQVELTSEEDGVSISYKERLVRLEIARPSVRPADFKSLIGKSTTQRAVNDLTANKYRHTFVTVDRAEPHKNIVRTVSAFGELLKQNPEMAQDVRFLLFLTRGPAHISAYKRLSEEIRRAARRVNDRFDGVQPVRVVEESTIYRAVAVLSIYDTLVHVPVIDGTVRSAMDGANLNSVAGGMIVSESSVAADLFGEFVTHVGFADTKAITDAMAAAIDESDDERRRKAAATEAIASSNRVGQMSAQILTSHAIAMGSREHH